MVLSMQMQGSDQRDYTISLQHTTTKKEDNTPDSAICHARRTPETVMNTLAASHVTDLSSRRSCSRMTRRYTSLIKQKKPRKSGAGKRSIEYDQTRSNTVAIP